MLDAATKAVDLFAPDLMSERRKMRRSGRGGGDWVDVVVSWRSGLILEARIGISYVPGAG
jgi:hypothetical protein